jgi:peptidoglycan/LPS O-acetylase OafA/YrhL
MLDMQATEALAPGQTRTSTSPAVETVPEHVPALDGLRGVAVLCVMVYHFGTAHGFGGDAYVTRKVLGVFCNLWTGVDIFFTLSGFLITGILLRVKSEPGYFTKFYARRALRIFPLYYLLLAVVFILLPLLNLPALDNPGIQRLHDTQWWNWAYSQDLAITYYNEDFFDPDPLWIGHLWSLGVEEHFYLVWPLVVWALSPRGLFRACLVMIATSLAVRFTMMAHHMDHSAVYTFTFSRLDELAMGGLLAILARERSHETLRRWAKWGVAFTTTYLVLCVVVTNKVFYWTFPQAQGFGFTALAIGSASVIVFAISPERNVVRRSLEAGWLRTLGKYSYGAYILHTPMQFTYYTFFPPQKLGELARPLGHSATRLVGLLGYVTLSILLTLGLAVISYHAFEAPIRRLKRFFSYDGEPAAGAVAAGARVQ